ncbi:MAG TPA: hypothetical protein VL172_10610 [Kofleriaceae bacterium]|nr:hypothetical protein [Kofleriaceae bacterium]
MRYFKFEHAGWKVVCYVDRQSRKVHDCLLDREVADQAAAELARAEIEAMYGAPAEKRPPVGENGETWEWKSADSEASVAIEPCHGDKKCWLVWWRAGTTALLH